jgi:hypothetical protein
MHPFAHLMTQSEARIKRLSRALGLLTEARSDANDLKLDQWEFALTLAALYREGLTEADIRLLISCGLVEHALEETQAQSEQRNFVQVTDRLITEQSCFIVTQAGSILLEKLKESEPNSITQTSNKGSELILPRWDAEARELIFRGGVVKRFRTPAHCQELVLEGFEAAKWVTRIVNPLPKDPDIDPHHQLRDTIRRLNNNQLQKEKIFFSRDGTGNGICWQIS